MDFREQLAAACREYKARAARAKREYKCLAAGGGRDDALKIQADGTTATVRIMGPLDGGWMGVDAAAVVEALDESEAKTIRVLVDSPGGLVTEGLTLYSDLRARADAGVKVITEARGLVASAAVLPFLAGDERTMGDGAMIMVHNPWLMMLAIGDEDDLEKESRSCLRTLRAATKNYRGLLAKRTGMTVKQATEAMSEETWYTAEEAVDAGYAEAGVEDREDQDSEMAEASARADEAAQRHVAAVLSRFA